MTDQLKAAFQAVVDQNGLARLDVVVTYPPQPNTENGEFLPTQP